MRACNASKKALRSVIRSLQKQIRGGRNIEKNKRILSFLTRKNRRNKGKN